MRTRVLILIAALCLAVPLMAAEKSGNAGKSAVGAIHFDKAAAEVISSLSFGVRNTVSQGGSGGGAGKVTFDNVVFRKPLSKLSKTLYDACAKGDHIAQVTFDLFDDKGNKIALVTLTNVLISSYIVAPVDSPLTIAGIISPEFSQPTETVSLSAERIDYILIGL